MRTSKIYLSLILILTIGIGNLKSYASIFTVSCHVVQNVSCYAGNDGAASASATGGIAPYTFLWSNGATANSISGLIAGNYTVTGTDALHNSTSCVVTISQPGPFVASSSSGTIACNGGSTSVNVSASGGTAPYMGTGSFVRVAGSYVFIVTDNHGCTAATSITVTQPTGLSASSSSGNITTLGGSTTVTVTASGGTAPYSGIGNFTRTAGAYTFTVTDNSGCTSATTVTLTQVFLRKISNHPGGFWFIDSTWAGGGAPSSMDTAEISTTGGGMVTVDANAAITTLIVDSGAILFINPGVKITVTGDLIFEGAIQGNGGNVYMQGTGIQVMGDILPGTIQNLTITNPSNVSLSPGNPLMVNGTLTFVAGNLITGAGNMVVQTFPNQPVNPGPSTGWVNGMLQYSNLPTSGDATVMFPVGDATNYAPIQAAVHGITGTSGTLSAMIASGISGSYPNNPVKTIQRTYTFSNGTGAQAVTFTTFDLTLNYSTADIPPTADTTQFKLFRSEDNGVSWIPFPGGPIFLNDPILGYHSIQFTGLTANSQFVVGQPADNSIPALSTWGLIVLGVLVVGAGVVFLRRAG